MGLQDYGFCNESVWVPGILNGSDRQCDCSSWHEDTENAKAISWIRIITSSFSVVGSASIILMVLLSGRLNTAEVHPLFILSVGDFILSILWMIGGIVWLSPGEHGWVNMYSEPHTGMCYVLGISTTMAEMVTFCLTTVYALNAFLRIREVYLNRGRKSDSNDKKKTIRHVVTVLAYFASWLTPLIVVLLITETVVGIDATDDGCWCIVDFYNLRPDNGMKDRNTPFNRFAVIQASVMGSSFVATTAMITVLYILTFYFANQVIKIQTHLGQVKGKKLTKFIVMRLTLFVSIYLICGLPTIIAAIVVWRENERLQLDESLDKTVLFIHAILAPLQGFLNAVVYGWSRKEFRKAVNIEKRLTFSRSGRARGEGGGEPRGHYHSLNNAQNTGASGFTDNSIVLTDGKVS